MKFVVAFVIFALAISANASVIPLGLVAAPAAGSVAIHAPAVPIAIAASPFLARGGIITHGGFVAHPGLIAAHGPAAITVAKTIW